ncbi:hypothetical protein D3C72_1560420 [compost metagenome]
MCLREPDLVHARDARDEIVQRREQVQQRAAHLSGFAGEHADISARAECLAGGAQQDDANGVARFQPLRGLLEVSGHRDIDGVERVRAVQRDGGDCAVGLQQQSLEVRKVLGHGQSPFSGKYQLSIQKPRC